jgi:hypothetical protein
MVGDTTRPAFIIVSANGIGRRAYEMYVERGRVDGFDREDWHRAERELRAQPAADNRKQTNRV